MKIKGNSTPGMEIRMQKNMDNHIDTWLIWGDVGQQPE